MTYFVRHASMGDRGLTAKLAYVQQMQDISVQLDAAKAERADLELRVHQFQNGSVDHDLLDEEARRLLGRAHPNELLVDLPQPRG